MRYRGALAGLAIFMVVALSGTDPSPAGCNDR